VDEDLNTLAEALAYLRSTVSQQLQLGQEVLACDPEHPLPSDLAIPGLVQRSIMLTSGFATMVEEGNPVCALPLVRIHIDNCMRLYAFMLAEDPHAVLTAYLEDIPLNRLRAKDGTPLTDGYLHRELSKTFLWVSDAYKNASGSVHFSRPGMLSAWVDSDDSQRTVYFQVGTEGGRLWLLEERRDAVETFTQTTRVFVRILASMLDAKQRVSAGQSQAHE
jgi:hypothetical protein